MKEEIIEKVKIHTDKNDPESALNILERYINVAHKGKKVQSNRYAATVIDMSTTNKHFDDYVKTVSSKNSSDEEVKVAFERFSRARKKITYEVLRKDTDIWNEALRTNNVKGIWKFIDWKGNYKTKKCGNSPSIQQFECFFEDLYDNNDVNELEEIAKLESDTYVPMLDDRIQTEEMNIAYKDMKKSGYDYNLPVLGVLITWFSTLLLTILNLMFFVKYPISLTSSLLSLIPKKGNLNLTKNYRGLQMMKLLACLYDRAIANRLKKWLSFNENQTAFLKGKSTLIPIFNSIVFL